MSPSPDATGLRPSAPGRWTHALGLRRVQVVLIVFACAMIYWPMLGNAGFSGTEGHRSIPAYHMLDGGDPLVPQLFDRPYLRKPPGMPWAIAASSAIFGETAFAARAVSAVAATLSALVAMAFGRRWFGAIGGLYAGLAQVLMPVFWSSARSADIESLHNLAVQIACLSAADIVLRRGDSRRLIRIGIALLLALGIAAAALTKGPAGATALAGTLIACCIVRRSVHAALSWELVGGILLAAAVVAPVFLAIARHAAQLPAVPVMQAVDEFLWEPGQIGRILLLLPASLLMATPASLAMLFPWGPDAIAESKGARAAAFPLAFPAARALTLAVLVSLAMLTIAGIGNPRYTMPTQMLIAPIAGYVGLGLGGLGAGGLFILKRPPIARIMMLGHPAIMGIGMLLAGVVTVALSEPRRARIGGRDAGRLIARAVPPGAEIWSDHLIEARPDVLWYAVREHAGEQARRVVWKKLTPECPLPPHGQYLILRDDALAGEYTLFEQAGRLAALDEIARGSVYQFSFRILRVRAADAVASDK